MNALLPLFTATPEGGFHRAANILAAARSLAPRLNQLRSLDRRQVSAAMTTMFGASDAEGAWSWRDAYDAIEAALVIQLRRLGPQLSRLEDAPVETLSLLETLSELTLTHSRRSEEQIALDQFSTPPQLGALAVLAGQVRAGDAVLEPSAGTGLLAVLAEACEASLSLNEISAGRFALLEGLFPRANRSQHDARHLRDILPSSGAFDVVLANPPFQQLEVHLQSAIDCLAEGGRLSAIVPARLLDDPGALAALARRGAVRLRLAFHPRAYARHGTSVETGLLVVDRQPPSTVLPPLVAAETLAEAALAAADVGERATARPRPFRAAPALGAAAPRVRTNAAPARRLAFLADAAPLDYETIPWSGEGRLAAAHRDGDQFIVRSPLHVAAPVTRIDGKAGPPNLT